MNRAVQFDTHKFIKHLTENGFTEQQAEEQVSLLNSNLATKADILALKTDIEAVRSDLLKWMFGGLIAQGSLVVALVKFL